MKESIIRVSRKHIISGDFWIDLSAQIEINLGNHEKFHSIFI